jgi:hypothetical protein
LAEVERSGPYLGPACFGSDYWRVFDSGEAVDEVATVCAELFWGDSR